MNVDQMKARYAELGEERAKLEKDIEKAQAPLLKDRHHKDRRTKIVPELNRLKAQVAPIASEMTNLAKALNGKM